jgi:hypothetical protein
VVIMHQHTHERFKLLFHVVFCIEYIVYLCFFSTSTVYVLHLSCEVFLSGCTILFEYIAIEE